MDDIIYKLINLLEAENSYCQTLKENVVSSLGNQKSLLMILEKQSTNQANADCYSCGQKGFCSAIKSVIYIGLDRFDDAIIELQKANVHFRNNDNSWNCIIGLELLGTVHELNENRHEALIEYQKALKNLTEIYLRIHVNDYEIINKTKLLKDYLNFQLANPLSQSRKSTSKRIKNKTKLAIPWIPAYYGLQAGLNGPIWIELPPEDKGSFTDNISLEDRPHNIYSVKQGDNQITLTSNRKYGWAKVSGDSMNGSNPVPILENDFVLFYESAEAESNAIVIASLLENSGAGYKYVVKRYAKNTQLLVSETEPPFRYPPISINQRTNIIGVVIGIAKPQ